MTQDPNPAAEGEPAIDEASYMAGSQRAWASMLSTCLSELSPGEPRPNDWAVVQLAEVRIALRRVCAEFGDNDWPDDLHLGDVIEKHLERHLGEEEEHTASEPDERRAEEPAIRSAIRRAIDSEARRLNTTYFVSNDLLKAASAAVLTLIDRAPSTPAKEPTVVGVDLVRRTDNGQLQYVLRGAMPEWPRVDEEPAKEPGERERELHRHFDSLVKQRNKAEARLIELHDLLCRPGQPPDHDFAGCAIDRILSDQEYVEELKAELAEAKREVAEWSRRYDVEREQRWKSSEAQPKLVRLCEEILESLRPAQPAKDPVVSKTESTGEPSGNSGEVKPSESATGGRCEPCGGTGEIPANTMTPSVAMECCPSCQGTGQRPAEEPRGFGSVPEMRGMFCSSCHHSTHTGPCLHPSGSGECGCTPLAPMSSPKQNPSPVEKKEEQQSGQAGGRMTREEIAGIRWLKTTGGHVVITDRQLYALLDAAERELATATPQPDDPKPA